jgi:hypothetical protein
VVKDKGGKDKVVVGKNGLRGEEAELRGWKEGCHVVMSSVETVCGTRGCKKGRRVVVQLCEGKSLTQ